MCVAHCQQVPRATHLLTSALTTANPDLQRPVRADMTKTCLELCGAKIFHPGSARASFLGEGQGTRGVEYQRPVRADMTKTCLELCGAKIFHPGSAWSSFREAKAPAGWNIRGLCSYEEERRA